MSRYRSNPVLLDHALSLSLGDLKRLGYLMEHHSVSGVVNWNNRGQVIGSVSVAVDVAYRNSIELSYKSGGKEYRQTFRLVSKPSNLKRGRYWLIQSPESGRLGRKVYLTGSGFQIRSDAYGCMYASQTESKSYRNLSSLLGGAFESEGIMLELGRKGFKKRYAGKPTKRYLRLMGRLEQSDKVALYEFMGSLKGGLNGV
jgi:hypothetical protein